MPAESVDAHSLGQAGAAALQAGDAATARRHFERIVANGQADAAVCVALALACQALNDEAAMSAAIEQALARDPRNLHALIMKGDYLAARGNARAATAFYGAAVTLASHIQKLPPSLAQSVARAAEARTRIDADIAAHLQRQLAAAGYDERTCSGRFAQSLDLLTGKKQRYVQQPRAYFFPELPNIQFYPRSEFAWLDAIEAATSDICAELMAILQAPDAFAPYIQKSGGAPLGDAHPLLDSTDWSACHLWRNGEPVPAMVARCPKTMAVLENAPLARIKGRTPSILFSRLQPGAHIPPHTGFLNTRLICHLPLIVPPDCHFRVGNEQRQWQRGRAWVFDDTIEHEAWNRSDRDRIVLIFDIWRPELSLEERRWVAALLEAVDTYAQGAAASWSV